MAASIIPTNLLNELQIKSLVVQERFYRDTQRWEDLRNCYHPDASRTRITISWYQGDIDGFVSGSVKMSQAGRASSSHTISPAVVRLNGDRAVCESTGNILARFAYEGEYFDCISYSRFVSRLVKVDGEWKMLTLECIYDKDTIQSVLPNGASKGIRLDPAARESYKCLSWVLAQNGFSIDTTLPGSDKPGSAEAVVDTCMQWLASQSDE